MKLGLLFLTLAGCSAPFSLSEAPTCSDGEGFASYAYYCADGNIMVCDGDSEAIAMCSKYGGGEPACTCDVGYTCNASTQAVACIKTPPNPPPKEPVK